MGDLAKLELTAAAYFPDGHIVYSSGSSINIADKDGANAKKLLEVPGGVYWLSVSQDGRRIRFTFQNDVSETLWEIKSDGTGRRELLKGWKRGDDACCGKWTKDGRYFVFLDRRQGAFDIWALPEEKRLVSDSSAAPVQLTNGPLSYYGPLPSLDNKTIFAVGAKQKGELSRYDAKRGEFLPFLGGISATDAMPSRDGQWVVFLSYPDSILWRSRVDGTDRMQLSNGRAFFPHISPDGSKVAFVAFDPQKGLGVYLVSMQGGTPQRTVERASFGSWSPDGKQLVVQVNTPPPLAQARVQTIDLGTGEVREISDSAGETAPYWPNPGTLVAGSPTRLTIFDLKTQKWSTLATGDVDNWLTSWDGKYMYFEKSDASGRKAFRIRLADRRTEPVAGLFGVRRVEQYGPGTWLGVTSDGSLLITRDIGTQEIYALDIKWP